MKEDKNLEEREVAPSSHIAHVAQNCLSEACANMDPGYCQDCKDLESCSSRLNKGPIPAIVAQQPST